MSTPNYAALPASDGAGEPVRATVQSSRSIGSTALTVNATTNWPTGTFIATTGTLLSTGKLDPTTAQVFYGTASGTAITITGWAAGYTDKGNAIGDVVVLKPTTEWANVVASGLQSTTQFPANFVNFVEPTGGVWSVTSGLVGAATAGNVWYNGTRSAMAAVTSKTFTASKDTYVDYNPSAATWTYVVVTNGATEPAVTTGCVRIALAAAGASTVVFSQGAYNTLVRTNSLYNPYKFSAYVSAASISQNPNATIVMSAKTFDTGSNFNTSTGLFTAPIAGYYQFSGCVGLQGGGGSTMFAALTKNGSIYILGGGNSVTSAQGYGFPIADILQLAIGDTVGLYLFTSNGGTTTVYGSNSDGYNTYLSGSLISAT
jgi:hypothetical protein